MGVFDVVRNDLAWLVREFEHGSRDRDEIRRSSAVVRRLLVDGSLQQGRKIARADGQPRMNIYPLSQVLDLTNLVDVQLFAAAGCQIEQRFFGPLSVGTQHLTMPSPALVESLTLPRFMKAPCIVAKGTPVTRNQVIKYVANKLGGVHFDSSRQRRGDEYIEQLEALDGFMIVQPVSVVDLALLSIIQAMVSSESVMTPFGLEPIGLDLNIPLNSGVNSIELQSRRYLKVDLMGDGDA